MTDYYNLFVNNFDNIVLTSAIVAGVCFAWRIKRRVWEVAEIALDAEAKANSVSACCEFLLDVLLEENIIVKEDDELGTTYKSRKTAAKGKKAA